MITRLGLVTLILVLFGQVPLQTANAASADNPPAGRIFRMRLTFEPVSLDWNLGDIPIVLIQNAMRGLYKIDEDGSVSADLVKDAKVSSDGKTWTFELQPGVLWSDSMPLKAEHVVAGLTRLLDPLTASTYAYFLFDIQGAREFNQRRPSELGIKVLSDTKFEIRLNHPVPYMKALLTHWVTYPVRPDILKRGNSIWAKPSQIPTLGSYKFQDWQNEMRIVLVANPLAGTPQQAPKPWFDRIEAWIIPDDNTALNLFNSGHFELVTEPGQAAAKRSDVIVKDSPITYFIGVGPGHPITSHQKGILALSAALNRTEIPKVLGVAHRPALEFCPPEVWKMMGAGAMSGDFPRQPVPVTGSKEQAKKLLAEAGITDLSDKKKFPPLTLRYYNRTQIKTLAEWIQAQWKTNLGIEVELVGMDPKSFFYSMLQNPPTVFINSKGTSFPDAATFYSLFSEPNMQNLGRWEDKEYSKHVQVGDTASTSADRVAAYAKANQILLDTHPALIPLYFRSTEYLIRKYVKDLKFNALSGVDLVSAHY
ncbi:peptide ABC transporter substrate-binding protein [bacterium]|jgi:oligopeptide transport system substrate-binding protein|nr:peptide ABC transporter substrate-binding protein [bacterium]